MITRRGHDRPPFLPNEIANLLNIKNIIKTNLGELSGMLLRFNDGYIIKVNENQPIVRQNFSCAHEIGHILINELKLDNYIASIEFRNFNPQAHNMACAQAKERLCDIVATEVLMPERIFKEYLSGLDVSISSLERLSKIFNTSIQTTAIRIAEVSVKPCIALFWKFQKRGTRKFLKLKYSIGPGRNTSKNQLYYSTTDIAESDSTIFKAYQESRSFECFKTFKYRNTINRLHTESKGYGCGEARHVITLASLDSL